MLSSNITIRWIFVETNNRSRELRPWRLSARKVSQHFSLLGGLEKFVLFSFISFPKLKKGNMIRLKIHMHNVLISINCFIFYCQFITVYR